MISQKCPKCLSKRVRRGYRPTPLWSKFLFRYNLLCDSCNWEFTGFAVPGTVSAKPTKGGNKSTSVKSNPGLKNKISEKKENNPQTGSSEPVVSLDNLAVHKVRAGKNAKAE